MLQVEKKFEGVSMNAFRLGKKWWQRGLGETMRSVRAYEIFNKSHKSINISSGLDIKSKGEVDVIDSSLDFGFYTMMAYIAVCEEKQS